MTRKAKFAIKLYLSSKSRFIEAQELWQSAIVRHTSLFYFWHFVILLIRVLWGWRLNIPLGARRFDIQLWVTEWSNKVTTAPYQSTLHNTLLYSMHLKKTIRVAKFTGSKLWAEIYMYVIDLFHLTCWTFIIKGVQGQTFWIQKSNM